MSDIFKYRELTDFEKVLFLERQVKVLTSLTKNQMEEIGVLKSQIDELQYLLKSKKNVDKTLKELNIDSEFFYKRLNISETDIKNQHERETLIEWKNELTNDVIKLKCVISEKRGIEKTKLDSARRILGGMVIAINKKLSLMNVEYRRCKEYSNREADRQFIQILKSKMDEKAWLDCVDEHHEWISKNIN